MSRFRRLGSCLAAVLVAATTLVTTTGTAHAAGVDQTCVGTWAVTYDPPITNDLRLVHGVLTGFFPTCTDLGAFNASYTQVFDDVVSCTELFSAGSASRTYVWGNPAAAPSTFTYNWTTSLVGGQSVITNIGTITSGRYAPDSAVQVATIATLNLLACAGDGISSLSGPTTLTIVGP
jgi:hypothetical protein